MRFLLSIVLSVALGAVAYILMISMFAQKPAAARTAYDHCVAITDVDGYTRLLCGPAR